MDKTVRVGLVLIMVFIMAAPIPALETGGYTVRPAYDLSPDYDTLYFHPDTSANAPIHVPEPQQIEYSDLPVAIFLILTVTGFLSLIASWMKLIVSGNLPAITGLLKLKRNNLLDNDARNRVYAVIRQKPGVCLSEIERLTTLTNKNVTYHVNKLLTYHMIAVEESANGKGYFPNSTNGSPNERLLVLHSKNPNERTIIGLISKNPGISRKEIEETMGISGPSVSWHISKLESDHIVKKIKSGTVVHHYIVSDYEGMAR
ncbi:MAG: winged helix-turn-helix transcriptional regulator [Methanoregula sp.]